MYVYICLYIYIYRQIYTYIYIYRSNERLRPIDLVSRLFTDGPGNRGSIPCHVILKTQKIALDTSSLNIQYYKECTKSKVEQS